MALTKVFQKYLSNIFISILQEDGEWIIYSKVIKNGTLKDKSTKTFEIKDSEKIPQKMQDYLDELQLKYNFAYIALFLDSMGQGAISGILASDFKKYSVDIKNVSYFNIEKKWSIYASFIDINWVKKLFAKVGLDFIFSPFVIQYSLIKKQKQKNKPILYMLNNQDSITITIFDKSNLLFGAYFKTTTDDNLTSGDEEDWENAEEEDSVENLVELDNIENDDMTGLEELDDFGEIDSLENDNEINSFEDVAEEDKTVDSFDDDTTKTQSNLELYGRDVLIYKYLTSSLKEFYGNPIYSSTFVDTIVIFDGYEVSSDLIGMIEDELLMEIEIDKVDISDIVYKIAREEVGV